jgi:hypothetical protein
MLHPSRSGRSLFLAASFGAGAAIYVLSLAVLKVKGALLLPKTVN